MLKVVIKADSRYPFDRKKVRAEMAVEFGRYIDLKGGRYWLSLLVCGKRKIRALNQKYRRVDEVTDVLSFPSAESARKLAEEFVHSAELGVYVGEVVVCYPVAREYAAKRNKLVVDELAFLARHGVKHLMGVHH